MAPECESVSFGLYIETISLTQRTIRASEPSIAPVAVTGNTYARVRHILHVIFWLYQTGFGRSCGERARIHVYGILLTAAPLRITTKYSLIIIVTGNNTV